MVFAPHSLAAALTVPKNPKMREILRLYGFKTG
jgi:hypothetical protein